MSRQAPLRGILAAVTVVVLAGCHPQQPFYFNEDGDLSHYKGMATELEYPDVESDTLADVSGAIRPFSLENSDPKDIWDLTLEEAVRNALANNKVMRSLGATTSFLPGSFTGTQFTAAPGSLTISPDTVSTVYDPALVESNPLTGVEAALSAFDAQFNTSVYWDKIDEPTDITGPFTQFRPDVVQQDLGTFQAVLSKAAATGGTWSLGHNVNYEKNNTPVFNPITGFGSQRFSADWNVNVEAKFRQPLLQGRGTQFNRIAGLGAVPGRNNGVMIARINTDIALVDFEAQVRNLVMDVEKAYWGLYMSYRELDAMIAGRDSALQTWRKIHALYKLGARGGEAENEAQAREQYFLFRSQVEQSLSNLYSVENNLRYLMGLAATDGRLIRPADEPTTAKVTFDWHDVVSEGLARTVEVRRQKWVVEQRELELIAAKNYLLPRLDAVGTYRWLGMGNKLIESRGGTGNFRLPGSNAYQSMTNGAFQEWQVGLELSFPLGYRKEMAGVRHAQLSLARERAKLQEFELEISHQLAHFIRDMESGYVLSQTNFNRRMAAQRQVKAVQAAYETQMTTLDVLLKAQRQLADAETAYYRALVGYVASIAGVHYRKGSLLEYNAVHLAEGPWPGKAYFDAHRRARARDASSYLDYGYTRPKVISRGPYDQHAGAVPMPFESEVELAEPTEAAKPGEVAPEMIPTPEPEPAAPEPEPEPPAPTAQNDSHDATGVRVAAAAAAPKRLDKSDGIRLPKLEGLAGGPAGKQSKPKGTRQSAVKWLDSKTAENTHETVANPPPAETDRSASGWKRVQRRRPGAGL